MTSQAIQANAPSPGTLLAGRTVLLTGAGGGLGGVFAQTLAEAGANLALTGRRPEPLAAVAAGLPGAESTRLAVAAEVTDAAALQEVVDCAKDRFGAIDVLVNNAGVSGPHGPLWETPSDAWWQALEVNLHGTALACRAVLPGMVARGAGRVINIVSAAGKHRWPYASAYSVSKAAIIKLTENLAVELRPHDVQVFSLHPGLLDVGITARHLAQGATGEPWTDRIGQWLHRQRDEGRFTPPHRAGELLLQLASGAADARSGDYFCPEEDAVS